MADSMTANTDNAASTHAQHQLGISWPDGSITWGDPVDDARVAKAGGWYASELEALRNSWRMKLAHLHVNPDDLSSPPPIFIRRAVTYTFSPID